MEHSLKGGTMYFNRGKLALDLPRYQSVAWTNFDASGDLLDEVKLAQFRTHHVP